jgi:Immunity protein 42
MLFGDKQLFAIEYEPIDPKGDELPECNFTYWIGGRAVGNYDLRAVLCEVAGSLRHILVDRGYRRNDELAELSSTDIVRIVRAWWEGDPSLEKRADSERWSAHVIGYPMDHGYPPGVGKRWKVYLVEGKESGRVIFFEDSEPEAVLEVRIPCGQVDAVLASAWEVLNRMDRWSHLSKRGFRLIGPDDFFR